MKKLILFIFLCISVNSFAGIYKVQDNVKECTLYFAQDSEFSKEVDINKLERQSVTASLVFQKVENKFNLKGLYGFFSLVRNVEIKNEFQKDYMNYTFKSVCLSSDKKIIYFEKSRKLFNNFNDLDRE